MDVFFTLFNNVYFGDQYDAVPTGKAWRGNYEKAKQMLRENPTFTRRAGHRTRTFPSLASTELWVSFLLLLWGFCCLFVWDRVSLFGLADLELTVISLPHSSWVLRIKACATMPGTTVCLSVCFSGLFVDPRLSSCLRPQGANSVVLLYHT